MSVKYLFLLKGIRFRRVALFLNNSIESFINLIEIVSSRFLFVYTPLKSKISESFPNLLSISRLY